METKDLLGNSGQVYQGRIENVGDLSGNMSNPDNGVGLETVTAVNLGEKVSAVVLNVNMEGRVANQGASDRKIIGESLDEGTLSDSSDRVHEAVHETVIVMDSGVTSSVKGENRDLGSQNEELGLRGGVINQEIHHVLGDGAVLNRDGQGSGRYSSNSVDEVVRETVIVIDSEENAGINGGNQRLEAKENEMRSSEETVDESETEVHLGGKLPCVIDMTCGDGAGGGGLKDNCDGEKVCRICHLTSEGLLEPTDTTTTATTTSMDLIQLGCRCKHDLGFAHLYCAEAWFKLKGNRICEICGVTAVNITGIRDKRFLERRFISSGGHSSERNGGCLRGQTLCNFLMACLTSSFAGSHLDNKALYRGGCCCGATILYSLS
ncbi:ZINC FINGER RING-CH-TYPE [Salix purpurea]|uniref:ZINC FINGER RING-CH-TYPE n=1 Tax=Salix purpurea TaxID=77065 RepID=A0A9Q1AG73_SALPP|nr:ZINC FINGER RING-CH-TYPE [Salix purpurea]